METRLTLLKADGKSPFWQCSKIDYAGWLPPYLPDCWQASWISGAPLYKPKMTRYFRRNFEADPEKLELAAFQWCCDSRAEVFVNGVSIGRVGSWAVPRVCTDLLKLLRPGKNTIAAHCYNVGANAGFFGELSLKGKDGRLTKIGTDDSWRYSQQSAGRWNEPDFDDSHWEPALVIMRPPQLPYGMAPYRNFADVPTLSPSGPALRLRASAGETVSIEKRFSAPPEAIASPVMLSVSLPGGEIFRCPCRTTRKEKELTVSVDLPTPKAAPGGVYTLSLECRGANFADNGRIGTLELKAGAGDPPLVSEVRSVSGKPVFFVNGTPTPVMFYRNPINFRKSTRENSFITPFDRAGVRISEINISFAELWNADGSVNTDAVDRYLVSPLFYAPNSSFIVSVNTDAPRWYIESHRSEWTKGETGENWLISYASEQYRRDAKAFLKKLLEYCKSLPLYNRIAGFGIDGGEDGQFMQWTGRNRDFLGDYSEPMRRYFHGYLQKKYGSIEALNRAWQTRHASFDAIPLPSGARRAGSAEKLFLDPVKDADVTEYHRAYSEAVADFVLLCAETVKETTENRKVVSAYYGKFFTIAGYLEYGEFSISRILRSPALDLLVAVEYNQRGTGSPHSLTCVSESYALHNKIFIDEADLRTFLSGSKNWAYAGTGFETVSMIRKMFLLTTVHGHGIHWYDLFGGIFENRAIMDGIGTVAKIQRQYLSAPKQQAEIAFIVDEESFLYTTTAVKGLTSRFLLGNQRGAWGRIGAPFDVWFADDLAEDRLPDYRMFVFVNVWAVSPKLAAAVEKLKKDGHLLVFLTNSGMIANGSSNAENVAALSGIKVKNAGSLPLNLRLDPANLPPVFSGLKEVQYSSAGNMNPVMLPDDPSATLFGTLQNGVSPVLALKKFPQWKSVYSAVPVLTPAVWRTLAQMAGVHIYSDDPDAMIYLGGGLFGVHTGLGGSKTFRFPSPVTLRDAVTGETVLRKGRKAVLPLKEGETKIFSVTEE